MTCKEQMLADYWGALRCESPQCLVYNPTEHGDAGRLRQAMRQVGVPVLELDGVPPDQVAAWVEVAHSVSQEFLIPVLIFGAVPLTAAVMPTAVQIVSDAAWLQARLVALTAALDRCVLIQEWRQTRDKTGQVFLGWPADPLTNKENRLVLAWSSPLPLRRLRDFSARFPLLEIVGVEAPKLVEEVAAQGICVSTWRIAVK